MSVTRITSIHCDACGEWSYGDSVSAEGTAADIRKMLRTRGWLVGLPGKPRGDICPKCQGRAEAP